MPEATDPVFGHNQRKDKACPNFDLCCADDGCCAGASKWDGVTFKISPVER